MDPSWHFLLGCGLVVSQGSDPVPHCKPATLISCKGENDAPGSSLQLGAGYRYQSKRGQHISQQCNEHLLLKPDDAKCTSSATWLKQGTA